MWQRFKWWFSPESRFQRAWHIALTAILLVAILVLVGDGVYGILTLINHNNAQSAKAQLDSALTNAVKSVNAPDSLLQPIRTKEQQVYSSTDGSLASWQDATQQYTRLHTQVDAIVNMPASQAQALAQKDLTALQTGVTKLAQGNYIEADGYQTRLQQAQSNFANAKTTKDFFTVDGLVADQVAAVGAFVPTYNHLQQFSKLVSTETAMLVQVTGSPQSSQLLCSNGYGNEPWQFWFQNPDVTTSLPAAPGSQPVEAQWLTDDTTLFRAATTAKDYSLLNVRLDGQIAQLQATNTALSPTVAASYLATFKSAIQTLQTYDTNIPTVRKDFQTMFDSWSNAGKPVSFNASSLSLKNMTSDISNFQKQYDADAQLLSSSTLDTYTKTAQQIQKHVAGMQFDLAYAKTYNDLITLIGLVQQGQAQKTVNPYDGQGYADAYEYADEGTGIGDIIAPNNANLGRLYHAQTTEDYQDVDREVQMFITNITAMLKNLNDPTTKSQFTGKLGQPGPGWDQVHQTDLTLMQQYGIVEPDTKVMVVSLREQVARFYINGKLIKALKVTTGAVDLPSIPGINCAWDHEMNTIFKSPDPPSDPNYYQPTPIHYALYYHMSGYEIHDAWWRNEFGLYTNLPHYDPAAFNGGSHGCINLSYTGGVNSDAAWVYNWSPEQMPVIVY